MQQTSGHVYVIGNTGYGTVKIGYARDVHRRLAELSTSFCPASVDRTKLTILRCYESPRARGLEMALHAAFVTARLPRPGFDKRSQSKAGEGWTEWFSLGRYAAEVVDHQCAVIRREWTRLDRY